MTHRVHNFNPGPAALPLPALERARDELLDYQDTGMSMLEHSHRGKAYAEVHAEAKQLLKDLLGVPDSHEILFLQGGASGQFALVPMNFLQPSDTADYIVTGNWANKALGEAQTVAKVRTAASTKDEDGVFRRIPKARELDLSGDAKYVHLTSNNTIFGTQFHEFPDTGNTPLVADMSSDILWKPIDVSRFSLIYAGAQKNLGPAGITVVIVRKDWAEQGRTDIPKVFRYKTAIEGDSLHNTIPTYPVYMVRNVLRWVKEQGGAEAIEKRNRRKAELVYNTIDENPDFFRAPVDKASRSMMNIVFRLPTEDLEKRFLSEAESREMVGLKGHRSVGGVRVSLYNAVEPESVQKLVGFMREFAQTHG